MNHGRKIMIAVSFILGAILTGCTASGQNVDQLFRSDTVVNIPLNPESTELEQTEGNMVLEETVLSTEVPAVEPTEASSGGNSGSKSGSSSKSSGSKTNSSTASGSKNTIKATEPTTEPTAGEPAETETAQTLPPEPDQINTDPPETEPPETTPAETEPPFTDPPETEVPEAGNYDASGYSPGSLEYAVAEQINVCRAEAGLEPLLMDGGLSGVASVRAYEVSVSWSHTRPNGRGWQTVLPDYGWDYSAAAEELAHVAGFDAASVVSKWINADSSKADLLNPELTTIGIGIYTLEGTIFLAAIIIG